MLTQNASSAQTQATAKFLSDLDGFVRTVLSIRFVSVEDINKSLAGNRKRISELKRRAEALALDYENEASDARKRVGAVLEREKLETQDKESMEAL